MTKPCIECGKATGDLEMFPGGYCAHVTDDRLVAYIGKDFTVTTWDGEVIGSYVITSSWRVQSHVSSERFAVRIRLNDGRIFKGRTFGEGMIVHAKISTR